MIILEFLVFVISSGVFCSEKFRSHIWAVIVAGAVATGSSLLFVYDLGAKLTGHEKEPPAVTKFITHTVVKTVAPSQPASVGKPHNCQKEYPTDSLNKGEEGTTRLTFRILTDGTVDAIKVLSSSGSERLDDAAIKCVSDWHYRPAIQNGQLAEAEGKAKVQWVLPKAQQAAPDEPAPAETANKPQDEAPAQDQPKDSHHWYDVGSWFSSDSDKKTQ